MTSIERLEIGPRMSQAVVHNGVVYLAGQVAADAQGAPVKEQTKNILERIDKLLAAAGTDKTKLLSVTIWLADMRSFEDMNSVWDKWVPRGRHACARDRRGEAGDTGLRGRNRPDRGSLTVFAGLMDSSGSLVCVGVGMTLART